MTSGSRLKVLGGKSLLENYQIAIYTRFNLPIRFAGVDNRPNIHMDKNWLNRRVQLFQELCLPSLKGQIEKNFTWFVCFAEGTPREYIDEICSIEQIVPIIAGSQTQAVERSRSYLLNDGLIITTRLDSDDSLSFNYLDELLKCVNSIGSNIANDNYVLSFAKGCEYDVKNKFYYSRLYPHNPFIAFCENISSGKKVKGIFHEAHFCMHEKYKTLLIPTNDPMWCINIHEGNVANIIKGKIIEESQDYLFRSDLINSTVKSPINLELDKMAVSNILVKGYKKMIFKVNALIALKNKL